MVPSNVCTPRPETPSVRPRFREAPHLCQLAVARGAGEGQQALALLRHLVDVASLVQQLPHRPHVPLAARLRQRPGEAVHSSPGLKAAPKGNGDKQAKQCKAQLQPTFLKKEKKKKDPHNKSRLAAARLPQDFGKVQRQNFRGSM